MENYRIRICRVDQKSIYAKLIKLFTRDRWSHSVIYCHETDVYYGSDIAGHEAYKQNDLPDHWIVDVSPKMYETSIHPYDSLRPFKYRFWSNIEYLFYHSKILRFLIRRKENKTNCIGWVVRYLNLPQEKEWCKPGDLDWED